MNASSFKPADFDKPITRSEFLTLANTALRVKEFRFTRQAALSWLAAFPGDLEVGLLHAQALIGEEKYSQVAPIIEELCQKDPEYVQAQKMRTLPEVMSSPDVRSRAAASVYALRGVSKEDTSQPAWSQQTWAARLALQSGDVQKAEQNIHQALASEPPSPLPAILHLQITQTSKDYQSMRTLANLYATRWPDCLQFKLYLAEALIENGDESSSVELIHQCAAHDATGQVSTRMWGANHAYKNLWPSNLEVLFDLPVPAAVAAAMGWNQLPGGTPLPQDAQAPSTTPQADATTAEGKSIASNLLDSLRLTPGMFRTIQDEFERLANRLRRPGAGRADGRYPVYVVFSTRKGLESQYGPQTAEAIITEMKNLVQLASKTPSWSALLFLADDQSITSPLGVKPAVAGDPWKLKLALTDLDAALAKKGEMIGAVLIVGGPQVVPFHRLPNPTDDGDADVSSDNPYASLDENYFIPNWPIGRLPAPTGNDAGMLLAALRRIETNRSRQTQPISWWRRNPVLSKTIKAIRAKLPHGLAMRPSFGYSASVWKQSSLAVFNVIGDAKSMLVCPPGQATDLPASNLLPATLSYFNLHGLSDGPDWYGQREAGDTSGAPDYPVAVTPKEVRSGSQATQFIFSEACYGATIENKSEDQSLAIKFMSAGCQVMVASTCISYGSVTTPLIGADLLGYNYWRNLKDGTPAGEALLQAKVALVNEMTKRQGLLDGEDQKTLISFVLFGDPLALMDESNVKAKNFIRSNQYPAFKVISDMIEVETDWHPVPANVLAQVKQAVDQYLPGLKDADFAVSQQVSAYNEEGHPLPGSQMGAKVKPGSAPARTVVRLKKQVTFAEHVHNQYGRVTVDSRGKVIKLSLSR